MSQHGDDLEDDFVPEDFVALSDPEADADSLIDPDDIRNLLSADEDEDGDGPDDAEQQRQQATAEKKRKRREKEKERKIKKRKLASDAGANNEASSSSIAARPPHAIEEYLASMQAKTFPKMSALELQDRQIPESSIADTTSWTASRTLEDLVPFIVQAVPSLHTRLSQRTKSPGSPTLLVLTSAALRTADMTRILKSNTLRGEKGSDVAKLFAKHFKLSEHVSYLEKTKVGAAVGTPGRVGKLLCDTDALKTTALTHILLDISHLDAKKRSLLDIPETRDEVFKTVFGAPKVMEGLRTGKIQVVLF